MDHSWEHLEMTVRRRDPAKQAKDTFRYHLLFALAGACLALSIVAFFTAIVSYLSAQDRSAALLTVFLPPVVLFAGALVCFLTKDNMRIEYDYAIEDGRLTVAKIRNLSSRKELFSVPLDGLKRIEPYTKERFDSLQERKLSFILNGEEAAYLLFCTVDGAPAAAALELNEPFLKALRKRL